MWRCEGVKMRRCEDEKMWRCEDVKVWRCLKMFGDVINRPPLLEEPFAQTLSGKRHTSADCFGSDHGNPGNNMFLHKDTTYYLQYPQIHTLKQRLFFAGTHPNHPNRVGSSSIWTSLARLGQWRIIGVTLSFHAGSWNTLELLTQSISSNISAITTGTIHYSKYIVCSITQ